MCKQEQNRSLSRGNKTKTNPTKNNMPSLRSALPLRGSVKGGDKELTICASNAIVKLPLYHLSQRKVTKEDFSLLARTSMGEKHDWFNHYIHKLTTEMFIFSSSASWSHAHVTCSLFTYQCVCVCVPAATSLLEIPCCRCYNGSC